MVIRAPEVSVPRIRTTVLEQQAADEVTASMLDLVSTVPPKSRPAGLARQLRETQAMMKSDDWSKAKASHLVALYSILHEMVYDVAPELKGDELKLAKMGAGSFLKSKCGGKFPKALEYMRWVWKRERSREEWRRENHIDGKVIGWRLILKHPALWTEYRVGQERRKHG